MIANSQYGPFYPKKGLEAAATEADGALDGQKRIDIEKEARTDITAFWKSLSKRCMFDDDMKEALQCSSASMRLMCMHARQ